MENRPNPDPLLGAPPWASELADRMRSYEQGLARLTCTVNEVNNKLDMLIAQFGASHAPVPESALTPGPWWLSYSTAPQLLQRDVASGWGFDGKFETPWARQCVGRLILTSVASGKYIGPRGSLLVDARCRRRGRVSVQRSLKFRRVQFVW